MEDPSYTPDLVAKVSKAARSLCMWTHAMNTYHRVAKVVEPKKMALRQVRPRVPYTQRPGMPLAQLPRQGYFACADPLYA